jgi:hypothetical protein
VVQGVRVHRQVAVEEVCGVGLVGADAADEAGQVQQHVGAPRRQLPEPTRTPPTIVPEVGATAMLMPLSLFRFESG